MNRHFIRALIIGFIAIASLAANSCKFQKLTVIDGEGGGLHIVGKTVTVQAREPEFDEVFTEWTGDVETMDSTTTAVVWMSRIIRFVPKSVPTTFELQRGTTSRFLIPPFLERCTKRDTVYTNRDCAENFTGCRLGNSAAWEFTNRNRDYGKTWLGAVASSGTIFIRRRKPTLARRLPMSGRKVFTRPLMMCVLL